MEQPGGGTPAPNVMAIRDQRHAKVSKQRTLLADADVSPRKNVPDVGIEHGAACMPSEIASDRATAPGIMETT